MGDGMTDSLLSPEKLRPLVSMRRLEELLGRNREDLIRVAGHSGRFYESFDQREIGKKKWRHLDLPNAELASLQKRIQRRILRAVVLPPTMLGAVSPRTIRDNASYHVGQPLVITLDLKACFPSIHDLDVYRALRRELQCSVEIADLLTKLTTYHHRIPQGASTSSTMANFVLRPMHDDIQALARQGGFRCTFWVDDITLSGARAIEAIEDVTGIVQKYGHAVGRRKLHRMSGNRSQRVTGITVNRKVSVPREYRETLRSAIMAAAREGVVSNGGLQHLRGQVSHVTFVCPEQGKPLERFLVRVQDRLNVVPGSETKHIEWRPCRGRHRDGDWPTSAGESPPANAMRC
jgi:hypothetical protein